MSTAEQLAQALRGLLASDPDGAIATAADADLEAAVDDHTADPIIRAQAAAVLNARKILAAHEAEKAQAPLKDVCPTCNGMGYLDGVGTRCGKCAGEGSTPAAPVAAWLPEHETPAMHDAVMAVLYQGVSRTGTNALWQAYRGAMPAAPAAPVATPVLVRDVADLLGTTVAAVSAAFVALGHAPRSTNMAVTGEEAVQVAVHLRAAQAAPHGFALVRSPITEAMHAAACKVLARADGLDGTPQRMLDAMLAAQAEPAPQWQQMGAESPEQWERFKAWQRQEGGQG